MRTVITAAVGAVVLGLVGCSTTPATDPAGPVASSVAPPAASPVAPPVPVADGPCPYLDTAAVEEANGQRVESVRTSGPDPLAACFFLRADGTEQARTHIVIADVVTARSVVDAAAPVDTSELAELPGGWSGGAQVLPDGGAVFAVSRGATALVVTTNQDRTVAARRLAEQIAPTLP